MPRARFARRALATALAAAFSHAPGAASAQVLPTGLSVVSGTADTESSSGRMVIRNSPNAILNWQSFSIGQPNTVIFLQDNANSKVLNRVVGNDPSNILGSMSSNGQVWLVNPNGVMFGQNARVNVSALVASTQGISNENFLAGRFAFGADGVPGGLVQNYGNLSATGDGTTSLGGHVWLIGGSVRNESGGTIQGGQIVLAAGQSVDLVDSGVPNVTVRVSASGNEVVNLGQVLAPGGGSIDLHGAIVNQNGIVRATSLDTSKVGHILIHAAGNAFLGADSETSASGGADAAGGQVVVKSDAGTASAQGRVLATSDGYGGGQIQLLGATVRVDYGATVDASGADRGGEVLIGTSQRDAGPGNNARNVLVNVETQIRASATRSGDGGTIVVRSDGTANVYGSLEAKAGANGGQGGMIETSGAVVNAAPPSIDVRGTEGSAGTWLLKANDITVADPDCTSCTPPVPKQTTVSNTLVQDTLQQGAHVRLEASGNLAVNADIGTGEQLPGARLTLAANNDVEVGARVQIGAAGNPMPVSLIADLDANGSGAIRLNPDARIVTAGADLRLGGGSSGNSLAQAVSLQANTLDAGSGNLYVNAATFGNTGDSVLTGAFIGISGSTLGLANLVLEASANGGTGSGSIGIAADKVAFAGTRINADNQVQVVGSSEISLGNSFLSAGGTGDAITLSTDSLTASASGLGTPNGRWLTYLNGTSAFSPSLFQSLGYTFVQVGADGAAPAVSGPGMNGVIVRAPLDVLVNVDATRVYDGTTQAAFSTVLGTDLAPAFTLQTRDGGLMQGRFADRNAGTGKTIFLDGASTPYAIATATGQPVYGANQTYVADITPKSLAASLTGADKVYDGTRAATVSGSLAGVVAGDQVALNGTAGLFDTKDAGTGKAITLTVDPLTGNPLSGADAGNYRLVEVSPAVADIAPRPITLSGVTALDKVYDGTRTAILSGSLAEVLAGDAVSLNGATGLFADKNAGGGKIVAIAGATLVGADAGNYALNGAGTVQASITPLAITLAGVTALDKVYDGTRTATLSGSLAGVLAGDVVSVNGATGLFADKNAGVGKSVAVTGATLAGADAGNYALNGAATLQASITPRPITLTGVTALDKVYDGTRTATLSGGLIDVLAGDVVSLDGATGLFADKNAGAGKSVAITGATLAGADAGNYALDSAGAVQASITPRAIALTGVTALDKVYDGTRTATLSGGLAEVLAGDAVSLDGATGLFADKNAGTGKSVAIGGATLAGADAGNYAVGGAATVQASIAPRPLTVAEVQALDKVYDGTRTATVSVTLANALPGDAVSVDAVGQFDTKNVGSAKSVAIGGALGGADAANYTLTLPASTSAAVTARPVEIVLSGDVRKEYDATVQASLAPGLFRLEGVVAGDAVTVRGPAQGSFASADAGSNKPVSASGAFEIGGADAANYRVGAAALTGSATTVQATVSADIGTITPATLVYQASPVTSVGGAGIASLGGTVVGFKGGDTLASATSGTLQWTGTATPASPTGSYAVYGSGLSAVNYQFVQAAGNATALELKAGLPASAPQQRAQDESARALATAVQAATPAAVSAATVQAVGNAVFDRSTLAPAQTFGAVRIGSMSQDELGRLIAYRKDFKRKLFADAIYKLDIDPSLADVRACNTAAEAASGTCRITPAQVAALQATAVQTMAHASARTVNLPKIERKIAVLFGINDYTDKDIPQLLNAVPDADAMGKVFADKLGYEVRIVRNPDKATIVRTLNALAAEAGSADSVAIYYAGHGISMNANGPGYWLASDSAVTDPKGWISNADIAHLLSGIRSKQVTLISDSCYSGAFAREGLGAIGQHVAADEVLAKRSVVVLSSGGDEPVPDEGKDGHSIFTWYLMQVIGSVTDWKQGSTIFSDVQAAVKKEFPQTPKYGSLTAAGHQTGGDYLFESRSN